MNAKAWYRQFWPWFLISLPLASVIGGISTVIIAFSNTDDLVHDQWYKEGRMINQTLTQDHQAKVLGLKAALDVINNQKIVFVLTTANKPINAELQIDFEHPTQKALDQTITLQYAGNNKWIGESKTELIGKYYVTITTTDTSWRLKGEANLIADKNFNLQIQP